MKLKKQLIILSIVVCLLIVGIPDNQKVFSFNSHQDQFYVLQPQSSVSEIIEQWNTTWSWSGWEFGDDITMDNNGDIYIAGTTNSFGAGGDDIFIAKYDVSGVQLWNKTWGGSNHDWARRIATDSNNDVYIAGICDRTLSDLGDAVLVKYSSEGSYLWERKVSWSEEETWFGITVDIYDSIYLTGKTESGGAGSFDTIIAKYDTEGNNQWGVIYTWGYSDYESGTAITVDNSGYIYITGVTNSSTTGDYDAYLSKIDAAGYEVWNRTWGTTGDEIPQSIAVDNEGYIYISGYYSIVSGANLFDIFLTKYDDTGVQKWHKYWGQPENGEGSKGVVVNDANSIYVVGYTNGSGAGGDDAILIKYNSSGTELWNQTWGGVNIDYAQGITMDSAGYIYITGVTTSFGLGSSAAFILRYVDNTPPSITSPADIEINQGTSNQNSTWIITDLTVDNPTYTVYRNGTENKTGSWTSGVPVVYNLDNFGVGSYNLTIVVSDGLGVSVQNEVLVDVLNNPPVLTQNDDLSYEKGTSDQKLSWTVTDTSVSDPTYIIYRNGTQMGNGSWTSGELFAYNLIDLEVGIYNFTIVVSDGLEGSDQDEVIVDVFNNPPVLTQNDDLSYEKGTSDQKLSWTVTDTSVSDPTYTIYRNGTQMGNGLWTSGELIVFNLTELQVGIYNFTIVIFDGLNGSDQDEVLVTVTATIGPAIGGYPIISIVAVIIVPIGILILRILRKRKKNLNTKNFD